MALYDKFFCIQLVFVFYLHQDFYSVYINTDVFWFFLLQKNFCIIHKHIFAFCFFSSERLWYILRAFIWSFSLFFDNIQYYRIFLYVWKKQYVWTKKSTLIALTIHKFTSHLFKYFMNYSKSFENTGNHFNHSNQQPSHLAANWSIYQNWVLKVKNNPLESEKYFKPIIVSIDDMNKFEEK